MKQVISIMYFWLTMPPSGSRMGLLVVLMMQSMLSLVQFKSFKEYRNNQKFENNT